MLRNMTLVHAGSEASGECWVPDGSVNNRGYKRRSWLDEAGNYWHLFTHQIMARLVHMAGKPLPEDAQVHHRCKNTECMNPIHLDILMPFEHNYIHQIERQWPWLFA